MRKKLIKSANEKIRQSGKQVAKAAKTSGQKTFDALNRARDVISQITPERPAKKMRDTALGRIGAAVNAHSNTARELNENTTEKNLKKHGKIKLAKAAFEDAKKIGRAISEIASKENISKTKEAISHL